MKVAREREMREREVQVWLLTMGHHHFSCKAFKVFDVCVPISLPEQPLKSGRLTNQDTFSALRVSILEVVCH